VQRDKPASPATAKKIGERGYRRNFEAGMRNIRFHLKHGHGYRSFFSYMRRLLRYAQSPRYRPTLLNIFRSQVLRRLFQKSEITLPFREIYYRAVNIPLYRVPPIRETGFFATSRVKSRPKIWDTLNKLRKRQDSLSRISRTGKCN